MKPKKNNFILNNKRILDSSGKHPKINNKFQYIIWCFIPNAKNFSGADWGREVKVAKNLFKKYKDLNFWKSFEIDFPLNSLNWFETSKGKKFLQEKDYFFKLNSGIITKKNTTYESGKVGKDSQVFGKKITKFIDLFKK
tara:strand:- start:42 stop:458 length:417 start_codon:yes stop_codon:yes gene_type:complete